MDIEDIAEDFKNITDVEKFRVSIQRKYKIVLSKPDLINIYNQLNLNDENLKNLIIKKKQKSTSGVIVITVLTSGNPSYEDNGKTIISKFSCKHNCAYCPNEKAHEGNGWIDQPRSYLYSEQAVLRANAKEFAPIKQLNAQVTTLITMGNTINKIKLINVEET